MEGGIQEIFLFLTVESRRCLQASGKDAEACERGASLQERAERKCRFLKVASGSFLSDSASGSGQGPWQGMRA